MNSRAPFQSESDNAPDSRRPVVVRLSHALLARPASYIVMALGILLLDLVTGPLVMFPILFVIPVVVSAWFCSARLSYALAVFLPIGRFLIADFTDYPDNTLFNLLNALIRIAVLVFVAFLVARTLRQTRQIKVLHGLLPICVFCKRIHADHDKWRQLEAYITEHSEAEFSHGICPECAEKNYGNILHKKERANGAEAGHAGLWKQETCRTNERNK